MEFLNSSINIICGPGATGKTTIALLEVIKQLNQNKKVLYLDLNNNFSLERFKQLSKENYKNMLNNLIIIKIKNFKKQHEVIKNLKNIKEISLIVIDPISPHYKRVFKHNKDLANAMLFSQLKILKELSNNIKIIIIDEVYYNLKENRTKMIAEKILARFSNNFIKLENNPRKIIMGNEKIHFEITENGIKI